MEHWPRDRAFHRELYVDLVRAYLPGYGSRRQLARALGVSAPYLTYLLAPLGAGTAAPGKWPRREHAERLAALLCPDAARRAVLLEHLLGDATWPDPPPDGRWLSGEEVDGALGALAHLREAALGAGDPARAMAAYARLWHAGQQLSARVHPGKHPLRRARTLLLLHEVACVRDRPGLALRWARQAGLALREAQVKARDRDAFLRLQVNVARAETVALNILGLADDARAVSAWAEVRLPGFQAERAFWLPQVYGDRLAALRRTRRFAVGEAEGLYDRAGALVADPVAAAMLDERFAGALIAHGSPRSLRQARPLAERCLALALGRQLALGSLQRALLLRTAAWYEWETAGESDMWQAVTGRCLALMRAAGLRHQETELRRRYGGERLDGLCPPNGGCPGAATLPDRPAQ